MRHGVTGCAIALLLAACGGCDSKKSEPQTVASSIVPAPDADAIQPLLPKDTACLVRVESASRLNATVRRLTRDSGMQLPPEPIRVAATLMGLDGGSIANDQPVFFALDREMSAYGAPFVTMIAPTADPSGAAASVESGKARTTDSYCAVSQDAEYEGGGAPTMRGVPGGLVSARCDWAGLRTRYAAAIDGAFAAARAWSKSVRPDPKQAQNAALVESWLDWAEALNASAQTIDLSLHEAAGDFDLQVAIATDGKMAHATPGGKRTALAELGNSLPDGMGMVALFHASMEELSKMSGAQYEEIYAKLPEESRMNLARYMERMSALNRMLDDSWGFAFDLSESGMRGAMVGTAADAAGFVRAYGELLQDEALHSIGIRMTKGEPRTVGDVTILTFRAQIDAPTLLAITGTDAEGEATAQAAMNGLLGEKGLLVEIAARGNRLFFGLGDAAMMDGMLRPAASPGWIVQESKLLGGEPALLLRVDPWRLLRGGTVLFRQANPESDAPPLPTSGPAPITLSVFVDGSVYRVHARTNLARLMSLTRGE